MWYYSSNNKSNGPVNEDEINQLFTNGVITSSTYVWKDGMQSWKKIGDTSLAGFLVQSNSIPNLVSIHQEKNKTKKLQALFNWWCVTNLLCVAYLLTSLGMFSSVFKNPEAQVSLFSTIQCVLYFPAVASMVLQMILFYLYWKIIQDEFTRTTPGTAIGFLFIPFYNFYWCFRAFWGLSKESNKYISRHFSSQPEMNVRKSIQWISLSWIVYSFTCGIAYYVFEIAQLLSMRRITLESPTHSLTNYMTAMQPTLLAAIIYFGIAWIMMTVTHIDFYLTAKSILIAEEQLGAN